MLAAVGQINDVATRFDQGLLGERDLQAIAAARADVTAARDDARASAVANMQRCCAVTDTRHIRQQHVGQCDQIIARLADRRDERRIAIGQAYTRLHIGRDETAGCEQLELTARRRRQDQGIVQHHIAPQTRRLQGARCHGQSHDVARREAAISIGRADAAIAIVQHHVTAEGGQIDRTALAIGGEVHRRRAAKGVHALAGRDRGQGRIEDRFQIQLAADGDIKATIGQLQHRRQRRVVRLDDVATRLQPCNTTPEQQHATAYAAADVDIEYAATVNGDTRHTGAVDDRLRSGGNGNGDISEVTCTANRHRPAAERADAVRKPIDPDRPRARHALAELNIVATNACQPIGQHPAGNAAHAALRVNADVAAIS